MGDLPAGTVTFLFTDIEGSTRLLQHLGEEQYSRLLVECRSLLRTAFQRSGGYEVDTQGDAFFVAFARATDAVSAAVASQHALASHPWPEGVSVRVRMGLHTGEPQIAAEGYVGLGVHHAARVMSAAHGGQVLLSQTTRELVVQVLPEGVILRDLGEHRLKDLQHASHLCQLVMTGLAADFPPLKTLDSFPHNLPVQPTPFLGREKEIDAVLHLLMHEDVRLLTLTGPGGTGKTRLALQVAAELSDRFAHGVFLVNLAPLSDPALVVSTIAQVLNVTDRGGQPILETLKSSLREKRLLLLLDNFEHVVQAALALAELLAGCPKLKMLVTSRMALHVRAEQEFAVPCLILPDPKHLPDVAALSQYEAVALFIARARAVKQDFQVTNATAPAVAEICVRLDGLPLAIELAAARSKLFPPQALLARLGQRLSVLTGGARDAPARQRTLRDTIAWSYQLLAEPEQRLFRRLAVFVGGCRLESIEALCRAVGDEAAPLVDDLTSLIDKNLLRQSVQDGAEPRLTLLETIREFGLECLTAHGEIEATQQAFAVYYVALAEQAEPELEDVRRDEWMERLEQEYDNLRAVLEWSLVPLPSQDEKSKQRSELGLRLAGSLREFWIYQGRLAEGLGFIERGLAIRGEAATAGQAKALIAAADLAFVQGNKATWHSLAEEAMVLCQRLEDRTGIALCLYSLGMYAAQSGEYSKARSTLEESVALHRGLGKKDRQGWALWALANLYNMQGEYTVARTNYEEALVLFREIGNKSGVAEMLSFLGGLLFAFQRDLAEAHSFIHESLTLLAELPRTWFNQGLLALVLSLSAELALSQDNLDTARQQAEGALALYGEITKESKLLVGNIPWLLSLLAQVEAHEGNYVAARKHYDEILTIARAISTIEDQWNLPIYLRGLAEVIAAQGEGIWAARLLGAAETLQDQISVPMPPVYRAAYEHAVATIAARLGERAFALARAEGRTMTLEQVLGVPGRTVEDTAVSAVQPATPPTKQAPTYPAGLTAREVEVLRLVAQGLSDAQVAAQLVISPRTVNTHLTSIYNKLGVDSRTAATRFAVEQRLV